MTIDQTAGRWWFAPLSAGSTGTKGLQATLMGGHLDGVESFVREVTQNAVDARRSDDGDATVSMDFRSWHLTPSQMRSIRGFLYGDGELARHASALKWEASSEHLIDALAKSGSDAATLRVLCVEDRGTRGLGGAIGAPNPDDHFSRLVYFFGQTHDEGSTKGGAFGFGKSVYSNASSLRTVMYYSRPADTGESRLIAVSLLPGHVVDSWHYLGYALCGVPTDNPNFQIHPITGTEADRLATAMGFTPRGDRDFGTSVMVLGCDFTARSLRSAMEKWWWPRLIRTSSPEGLVVRFHEDGVMSVPEPRTNPELAPFVRAYGRLLDDAPALPDARIDVIRSTAKKAIGKVVLERIDPPRGDGDDEDPWYRSTVAMLRGPKLVVKYASGLGGQRTTPFVGVFVADGGIETVLRNAENPAHTDWDDRSGRLNPSGPEPAYVRAVTSGCKKAVQSFLASFEAQPPKNNSQMNVLGDLLGRLFSRGTAPGGLPKAPPRPIHLRVTETRIHSKGYDQAMIEVRANQPGEMLPARITVSVNVLGDAKRSVLDQVEVGLFDADERLLAHGLSAEYAFEIPAQGSLRFTARAQSPGDSPVRFHVIVAGRKS
jgi:hypothetical protein